MSDIYSTLNPQQQEAVYHTEGPLLILAGAGSGKTRVLTHRIAYLIDKKGINPWNILAITFTNKAASEMRERVDKIVGFGSESVWVSTFHSTCVRILRRYIDRLGYDTRFAIYDTEDQKTLMKEVCRKLNIDTKKTKERSLLAQISHAKDELITPDEMELNAGGDFVKKKVAEVYREYQAALRRNNALDFDDLIVKTVELFQNCGDVLENYQERFRYIMVDEYQDTNTAQFKFISLLASKYENLCVVGDDDQSIYKFRGANIGNILGFEHVFPDAKVIRLEQNYRSTKNILNAANAVIANNTSRKSKTLWTENSEGERIHFRQFMNGYEEAELANFRIAAGLEEGEFYGMVFQDSDVAKWLEGVAYALEVRPDAELEERADKVIEIIEKAQQDDGYLNTFFTIKEPEHRWQNLQECHELYCAGHMMEAAAAYYEVTGKDRLLHVMERMAEHIGKRFGTEEGKEPGIPGHQEIELGLLRLYEVTGKENYKDLARYFIEQRGKDPDYFVKERKKRGWVHFDMDVHNREYNQAHATVYEQKEAVGHSVRAVYMYTAMAELASLYKDEKLYQACCDLWENMTQKRMYITGGIGSTVDGEAFTIDYDLPNDTVYAETCASIGLVFFARKMLDNVMDGRYADVMERALYNGIISGMQLDGKRFFYVNPLETEPGVSGKLYGYKHVLPERPGWYTCACCPPNVVRLLMSLGKYLWSETEEGVYSHIPAGTEAHFDKMDVTVESNYPWDGRVTYHITGKTEKETILGIHIPSWVRPGSVQVRINGKEKNITADVEKGYLILKRVWENDEVELVFPMKIRKIYANLKVREDAGCVAFMRGPIVYCFEGVDNPGLLQSYHIFEDAKMEEEVCKEGLLEGCVLLKIKARKLETVGDSLYSDIAPVRTLTTLTAVPYYTWGNRGENQMRVWMRGE